jgi:hypothetical protein
MSQIASKNYQLKKFQISSSKILMYVEDLSWENFLSICETRKQTICSQNIMAQARPFHSEREKNGRNKGDLFQTQSNSAGQILSQFLPGSMLCPLSHRGSACQACTGLTNPRATYGVARALPGLPQQNTTDLGGLTNRSSFPHSCGG